MSGIPHRCAWCGAKSAEPFDKRCYGKIDGATKASMRSLIAKGYPQHARRLGLTCLAALEASGVQLPERRSDHFDDDGGSRAARAPMARSNHSPGRSSCARPVVKLSGSGVAA